MRDTRQVVLSGFGKEVSPWVSPHKSLRVRCSERRYGGYSTWINFDSTDDQVQDNPERHDYNVDQWVDFVVQSALDQANHTKTDHQLWACGTDFQYQNSDHWFTNLDKLIHYLKQNGTINAFYSTPSLYVDAKKKDTSVTWEVCYVRVLVFENFNESTSRTSSLKLQEYHSLIPQQYHSKTTQHSNTGTTGRYLSSC